MKKLLLILVMFGFLYTQAQIPVTVQMLNGVVQGYLIEDITVRINPRLIAPFKVVDTAFYYSDAKDNYVTKEYLFDVLKGITLNVPEETLELLLFEEYKKANKDFRGDFILNLLKYRDDLIQEHSSTNDKINKINKILLK